MFANVGITFERMNIFTCGKKQMVAWIKAVTGGGLGPGQGPNIVLCCSNMIVWPGKVSSPRNLRGFQFCHRGEPGPLPGP